MHPLHTKSSISGVGHVCEPAFSRERRYFCCLDDAPFTFSSVFIHPSRIFVCCGRTWCLFCGLLGKGDPGTIEIKCGIKEPTVLETFYLGGRFYCRRWLNHRRTFVNTPLLRGNDLVVLHLGYYCYYCWAGLSTLGPLGKHRTGILYASTITDWDSGRRIELLDRQASHGILVLYLAVMTAKKCIVRFRAVRKGPSSICAL